MRAKNVFLVMMLGLPTVGCDSPAATLRDSQGMPFKLWQNDNNAIATVLTFTRSDCPISNRYAPTANSLVDTYQTRGVDILLVYVNPREMPNTNQSQFE